MGEKLRQTLTFLKENIIARKKDKHPETYIDAFYIRMKAWK